MNILDILESLKGTTTTVKDPKTGITFTITKKPTKRWIRQKDGSYKVAKKSDNL